MRLTKQVFVVSLVTMFLTMAVVQAIALAGLGLYDWTRLGQSVLALVPIMIVLRAGTRYADRLSSWRFDRWIMVLLVVFAANLVYDGLFG